MGRSRCAQPEKLATKLASIRARLELSQEQMAKRLEGPKTIVYPGHVSEYELGKRCPSVLIILQYARLARVSVETLIDDGLELPKRLQR